MGISQSKPVNRSSHALPSYLGQSQTSLQAAEDYWIQSIKKWYPELHFRTYFLPPLHFNRVPYCAKIVAGEQVLVPQIPQDGPRHTSPTTKRARFRSHQHNHVTKSIPSEVNNLTPVYDREVRDDKALQRVLLSLRSLADNSQPKEVMMVVSQLRFGKYLGESSYAAVVDLLPRPSTLPANLLQQHYDQGDFDVLLIHRHHGLFTLEIKSVGENFSQLNMTEEQEDTAVLKKVKEALKQLNKSEVVLKHLTSDLHSVVSVTKTIALPNITSIHLLRAFNRDPSVGEALCQCLCVRSVDDALKLSLTSDQLSDLKHNTLTFQWWKQLVSMCESQPLITSTIYEQLVARFCGPATTVEVHCVTTPRLAIRTLGDGVSETGERVAMLALFPQEVDILNQSPSRAFLSGPPGTGKTVVLILQGLSWLRRGHDVHVVSTWDGSRASTIVIQHQLQATMKTTTASSRVHRHQFNFWKDEEVKTAVGHLQSLKAERQLCVIADEAICDYSQLFAKFCDWLIIKVPGVCVWGASVRHEVRPTCLEEFKLTTPLRSPPVIVREVMGSGEIKIHKQVYEYTVSDVPAPTDGPAIMHIKHRLRESGHTEYWPRDCVECGHEIARILTELNVGLTGATNGPPPLQYRDVFVLCVGYPNDDRVDRKGRVISRASGLVRGLREQHIPVLVVEKGDEAAIRDTALGISDLVTVTDCRNVQGLERKVVVVQKRSLDLLQRLQAVSRCTSQLVLINW